MLLLKEFEKDIVGFPSLLNFFGVVNEGVILNNDGSLTAAVYYKGPDMESNEGSEENVIASHVNAVLSQLTSGWTVQVESLRIPAVGYPKENSFEKKILRLIEKRRKSRYEKEGNHYETINAMVFTYKPQIEDSKKINNIFVKNASTNQTNIETTLVLFNKKIAEMAGSLSARLEVETMNTQEILSFMMYMVTGKRINLQVPENLSFLNYQIGGYEFIGGINPKIDNKYIKVVSVIGYPQTTHAGILNVINQMAFEYRLSNRFIFLDEHQARKAIKEVRKKFSNKQFDFKKIFFEVLSDSSSNGYSNNEAANKAEDANEALAELDGGYVKYGYYTSNIVIMGEDIKEIERRADQTRVLLEANGFAARIEKANAVEAYLGSIPANNYANVRRPLVNTLNLSHMVPLTNVWAGLENNPNPMMNGAPALFYGATVGSTPFRFNLHVSDVGHTLIVGATGSGKSVLLNLIASSFKRYENAQVYVFEKGMSQYVLTKAIEGEHYNILSDGKSLTFCPLKETDKESEALWAKGWVEELIQLQGVKITPVMRNDISIAVDSLKNNKEKTLTNLFTIIQNDEAKEALTPFVEIMEGAMSGLLDSAHDGLQESSFKTFEMEELMSKPQRYTIPVLTYLFHRIENTLDGRPTLIVIDEAWLMFKDQTFREKIEEWLRVLRKKNACVVFATNSMADIINNPISEVLIESCPTKIYLPNPSADNQSIKDIYKKMGLNDKEISIIKYGIPKQQYYYTSPYGQRMIELGLGALELSIMGISKKEDIEKVKELSSQVEWLKMWLREQGLESEVEKWRELSE